MNLRPTNPDPSEALRHGVDALRGVDPDYDVAAGVALFESTLGTTPTPASPGIAPWLRVVSVVVVIVAGAAVIAVKSGERDSVAPRSDVEVVPSRLDAPVRVDTPKPATTTPLAAGGPAHALAPERGPTAEAPSDAQPRKRRKREVLAKRSPVDPDREPASTGDDSLVREMALLDATRKQVRSGSAQAALGSIASARGSLSKLHFDEEWDALEILALAGAGRLEDARRLARPFLSQHVAGRFNATITRAIEQGDETSAGG